MGARSGSRITISTRSHRLSKCVLKTIGEPAHAALRTSNKFSSSDCSHTTFTASQQDSTSAHLHARSRHREDRPVRRHARNTSTCATSISSLPVACAKHVCMGVRLEWHAREYAVMASSTSAASRPASSPSTTPSLPLCLTNKSSARPLHRGCSAARSLSRAVSAHRELTELPADSPLSSAGKRPVTRYAGNGTPHRAFVHGERSIA